MLLNEAIVCSKFVFVFVIKVKSVVLCVFVMLRNMNAHTVNRDKNYCDLFFAKYVDNIRQINLENCMETEAKCVAGLSFVDYMNYVNSTQFS